jgi:hypothetical protein
VIDVVRNVNVVLGGRIIIMGKTTVIRFIPDPKEFAKAYAEFIKRKKERGEECS